MSSVSNNSKDVIQSVSAENKSQVSNIRSMLSTMTGGNVPEEELTQARIIEILTSTATNPMITNIIEPSTVRCGDIFERFSLCSKGSHQFHQLRIHGSFENCNIFFKDWRICMAAKLKRDEDDRIVSLIANIFIYTLNFIKI